MPTINRVLEEEWKSWLEDRAAGKLDCKELRIVNEVEHLRWKLEQARYEATQTERRTLATVVEILLEGKSGAAYNTVCEDYPAFAELVGWGIEQAKREAFLEAQVFIRSKVPRVKREGHNICCDKFAYEVVEGLRKLTEERSHQ